MGLSHALAEINGDFGRKKKTNLVLPVYSYLMSPLRVLRQNFVAAFGLDKTRMVKKV